MKSRFIPIYASIIMMLGFTTVPQQAKAAAGTNYYVCDNGNDANDGLSIDTPWKTFEKGMSQYRRMNAGDAVLFCRGGVFPAFSGARIYNVNCTADVPCVVGDYYPANTTADTPRPHINSRHSGRLFNFQDGGNADHDEGYVVKNLRLTGRGDGSGVAVFFYNDVDDVVLDNLTIDSFLVAVENGGANKANSGANRLNERISVSQVEAIDVKWKVLGVIAGSVEESLVDYQEPIVVVEQEVVSPPVVEEVVSPPVVEEVVSLPVEEGVVSPEIIAEDADYYVCDNGNDANDGQSMDTPWKSYNKAMSKFKGINAGESIAFCRGGIFPFKTSPKLYNFNCTAKNRCVIKDYISPSKNSTERPVILSLNGDTALNFQDGANADQDGGYLLKNLVLESNVDNYKSGVFLFNDVDDLTIDNLKIDGFKAGILFQGANKANAGANNINERIIVKNSTIVNNSDQGFNGVCSDCLIDSNYFNNNGYARKILNHNIYLSSVAGSMILSRNMVISNNVLKNNAIVDGKCSAVSLVAHGVFDNLRIENNLIEEKVGGAELQCWGMSLDPAYVGKEEYFKNIVIKGNKIVNVGGLGIGCASCTNVLIESNEIINEQSFQSTSIKIPSKSSEDSVKSANIVVRDNLMASMYNGQRQVGISLSLSSSSPLVEGNILYSDIALTACYKKNGKVINDRNSCEEKVGM